MHRGRRGSGGNDAVAVQRERRLRRDRAGRGGERLAGEGRQGLRGREVITGRACCRTGAQPAIGVLLAGQVGDRVADRGTHGLQPEYGVAGGVDGRLAGEAAIAPLLAGQPRGGRRSLRGRALTHRGQCLQDQAGRVDRPRARRTRLGVALRERAVAAVRRDKRVDNGVGHRLPGLLESEQREGVPEEVGEVAERAAVGVLPAARRQAVELRDQVDAADLRRVAAGRGCDESQLGGGADVRRTGLVAGRALGVARDGRRVLDAGQ